MKQNCKKNQTKFRVEKVIKGKDNKLYIKWKCSYSSLTVELIKKLVFRTTQPQQKQNRS